MGKPLINRRTAGIVQVVLGIAVALFDLVGLVRLPGTLAAGDGATSAGALTGVVIFAAIAFALLFFGIKRLRATHA